MVEKTPNHQLNKFESGDTSWSHTPDMETIEERLVVRSEEAKRNEYRPHEDALFFSTDTSSIYLGSGDSWDYLGSLCTNNCDNGNDGTINVVSDSGVTVVEGADALNFGANLEVVEDGSTATINSLANGGGNTGPSVIKVPSDYNTLSDAFSAISDFAMTPGGTHEILIESGHALQSGVHLDGGYYSHVTIKSEDSIVPVDSGFSGTRIINIETQTFGPTLDCLVDGGGDTSFSACYRLRNGSSAMIGAGAGFQNFPSASALSVSQNCRLAARDAIARNCRRGLSATHNGASSVRNADLSANSDIGLRSANSNVDAEGVDVSASDTGIRVSDNGFVRATNVEASNCGSRGASVSRAFLNIRDGNVSGSGSGDVGLWNGGVIFMQRTTTTNGNPSISDVPVSSFGETYSNGIIYI